MNIHLVASLLIVAATAVIGILQGTRLGEVNEAHLTLQEEASALGLAPNGGLPSKSDLAGGGASATGAKGARSSSSPDGRSGSADHQAEGKAFAQELFAFWQKMKQYEGSGTEPTLENKKEMFAFINRFLSLDAEVIPYLMDEIRANTLMDDNAKREILGFALMTMAQSAPEKAMELYVNSTDLFDKDQRAGHMVKAALGTWAAQDPRATLAWLDLNGPSLQENLTSEIRVIAIANAFRTDPEFAIEMALALDNNRLMELVRPLGSVMQNPQDQLDLLRRIEDKLGPLPTDPNQINESALATASSDQVLHGTMLVGLGNLLARETFQSASQFLDNANLGPIESVIVAKGLTSNLQQLDDPGAWLPWIQANTPEAERESTVSNVVSNWTRSDFRATAAWITEQPDGPLREQATYAFAETVAPHEPASAADWALSLPASPERTELLQNIHTQWIGKDPEAAATFATENGLPTGGGGAIITDP